MTIFATTVPDEWRLQYVLNRLNSARWFMSYFWNNIFLTNEVSEFGIYRFVSFHVYICLLRRDELHLWDEKPIFLSELHARIPVRRLRQDL